MVVRPSEYRSTFCFAKSVAFQATGADHQVSTFVAADVSNGDYDLLAIYGKAWCIRHPRIWPEIKHFFRAIFPTLCC